MTKTEEGRTLALQCQFSEEQIAKRKRFIGLFNNYGNMTIEVYEAMQVVKAEKLYWPYRNLEEFCKEECNWTRRRLNQVLRSVEIRRALPEPEQNFLKEGHTRELEKVPEETRPEVIKLAKRVYSKDGKISAKAIRAAAEKIAGPVDDMGYKIPEGDAQRYWERKQEVLDILSHIRVAYSAVHDLSRRDIFYSYVRVGDVEGKLDSAINQLEAAVPSRVCPTCQGIRPDNCAICHGVGLISKPLWDRNVDPANQRMRERECQRIKKT